MPKKSKMPKWSDFAIITAQAIFFFPEPGTFVQSQVLSTVLEKYAARYDGDMQTIPANIQLPSQMPRLILTSANEEWQLQAGPQRLSSVWNRVGNTVTSEHVHDVKDIVDKCVEVLEHYASKRQALAPRLALVLTWVCLDDAPAQHLIERFIAADKRETLFKSSKDFQLHNHETFRFGDSEWWVNFWIRFKVGLHESTQQPVTILEQDLNTLNLPNVQYRFDAERLRLFFDYAIAEAQDKMREYLP